MITRISAFTASDGKTVATIEEAQIHELTILLGDVSGMNREDLAKMILREKDKIIDVLTTTTKSKTRERSINGGKKSRLPKTIQHSETGA